MPLRRRSVSELAVLGLDHVQVAIPEGGESGAKRFYGELLGLDEVPKPANLSPSGCWFEAGTLKLHIGVDPDFRPARKAHPAILVSDLASLRQRFEAAGVATHDDKPVEGFERFFAFDPFGNRIELMEAI